MLSRRKCEQVSKRKGINSQTDFAILQSISIGVVLAQRKRSSRYPDNRNSYRRCAAKTSALSAAKCIILYTVNAFRGSCIAPATLRDSR